MRDHHAPHRGRLGQGDDDEPRSGGVHPEDVRVCLVRVVEAEADGGAVIRALLALLLLAGCGKQVVEFPIDAGSDVRNASDNP